MGNSLRAAAEHAAGLANTVHFMVEQLEAGEFVASQRAYLSSHGVRNDAAVVYGLGLKRKAAAEALAEAEKALNALVRAYDRADPK